ncbi:MAG: 5,10-methylenetetrahydromethanopterin reductase [Candidatus Bathyarchaeia archaeon]
MRSFGVEFVPQELYWRTTFYVMQAEKRGFDFAWITDHFNNRNVYVSLGFLAAYTDRIKLGLGVTNPYLVHPAVAAQSISTLNEMAPRRVILGMGAGDKTTLDMVGVSQRIPLTAVQEAVEIVRKFIGRDPSGFEGKMFQKREGSRLNFKVLDRIPIYIGAQGPKMLALAGRIGDGVLINASHPEDVKIALSHVERGVGRAGRRMTDLDVAAYTSFSIARREEDARGAVTPVVAFIAAGCPSDILRRHDIPLEAAAEIREALVKRNWGEAFSSVTPEMIEAFSICGTPEKCIEKVDALFQLGITQFVAGSPLGPGVRESIDLLGDEVLKALREEG